MAKQATRFDRTLVPIFLIASWVLAILLGLKGGLNLDSAIPALMIGIVGTVAAIVARLAQKAEDAARAAHAIAEHNRALLSEAVESINEGFVLFDDQYRLVICNTRYRSAYPLLADALVEGTTFQRLLEIAAERGQYVAPGKDQVQPWVQARMGRHLTASGPVVAQLSDGRRYVIDERATPGGGIVKLLTDISALSEIAPSP